MTCAQVREAAAEYALDILDPEQKADVAAHLANCPECRQEVAGMRSAASRLLDLVPGTEPPLGFDRRVLERMGVRVPRVRLRRRSQLILSAAAAVLIVAAATFAAVVGHQNHHAPAQLASAHFERAGSVVGDVTVYKGPNPWIDMTVKGLPTSGTVSCDMVGPDGRVTKLGSFDLVDGGGSWGAPDPWTGRGMASVELMDSTGHVLASADFS